MIFWRPRLSIKHVVKGCLEARRLARSANGMHALDRSCRVIHAKGVFAWGQCYVLISRVTHPDNFQLIGLPPIDIVEEVRLALRQAGYPDPDAIFEKSTSISQEWVYDAVERRFYQKRISERSVPMMHRTLAQTLDPQPKTAEVLKRLLDWIDLVDMVPLAAFSNM